MLRNNRIARRRRRKFWHKSNIYKTIHKPKVGAGKELLRKQKFMIAFTKFQHFSSDLVGMLQKTIPCIPVERKHLLPTKPWTRIQ